MFIQDISADHSQLLVSSITSTGSRASPLWSLPLPAGSPRRLGDIEGNGGDWSRDGKQMVFTKGTNLYLADADGTSPRLLVSLPGTAYAPIFSPDGSRIRLSIAGEANTNSLWEGRTDGSGLHQLLKDWHATPNECCGRWTPDGRYYVFESGTGREKNIFALAEPTSIFRKISHTPVQLTTGPILYSTVLPDVSGRRLFVEGIQSRGELVRYDATSKQFVTFMGGISATDLAFTRDRNSVTYTSVPDAIFRRTRVDGSERLQLTYPPAAASLPCWSPDGTQIAYISAQLGKPWKIFLISAQGASPT